MSSADTLASVAPVAAPAPAPASEFALSNRGLLPIGLQDQLPPDAEREAATLEKLMHLLGQHGYDRVKPPLLEFERTLLDGSPAKLRRRSFRVVDPLSKETLVLRSDMTGQVVRMASSRLKEAPRPLMLSYGGQVVRVTGSDLRPERQFTQVGAETIGVPEATKANTVLEAVALAIRGLEASGLAAIVADFVLPDLLPRLCARHGHGLSADLLSAIAARDPLMVSAHACGDCLAQINAVMALAGPWRECLDGLVAMDGVLTADEKDLVTGVCEALERRCPGVDVTLDPAELRGFEYHSGIGFVLFTPSGRGELGRGGCYETPMGETGIGFTLYLDSLVRALGPQLAPTYVLVPRAHLDDLATIQAKGLRTRVQLDDGQGAEAWALAAKNMGCAHYWDGQACQQA